MDSKVVYYDFNFLKIGHALTTNPHKKQFKHALMCNHPIIISVELVSLVESHVVEFYIRFIKKNTCAGSKTKSYQVPQNLSVRE